MSQPHLLLLQTDHNLEMRFCSNLKSTTNNVYRRSFGIFLLLRSFVKCTSHVFVYKITFVLHHIKNFPRSTRCFFDRISLGKTCKVARLCKTREDLLSCAKPARASKPAC